MMRRRLVSHRPTTAEATVALRDEAEALSRRLYDLDDPQRRRFIDRYLHDRGSDPTTAVIARYWIRRGTPNDHPEARYQGWTR